MAFFAFTVEVIQNHFAIDDLEGVDVIFFEKCDEVAQIAAVGGGGISGEASFDDEIFDKTL